MSSNRTSAVTATAAVLLLVPTRALAGDAEPPRSEVATIELVCLEHLDIGFTAAPQEVARREKEHLDHAIALCQERSEFRWTVESIWQLEEWRARTRETAHEGELQRLIEAGQIEIAGGFANFHSGVMDAPLLLRAFEPGLAVERDWGIDVNAVVQDDVPGFAWLFPTAMARAGHRYFLAGVNTSFGGGTTLAPGRNPFWWEGPDGGRVLTWVAPGGYGEAETWGLGVWSRDGEANTLVPQKLAEYAKAGFHGKRVLLMATTGDNGDPNAARSVLRKADAWNATHATPKVCFTTPGVFLASLEQEAVAATGRDDGGFPIVRGDWSGHWEVVKTTGPAATALYRDAQALLPGAEALALRGAIELGLPYPHRDLADALRKLLVFSEHSQPGGVGWPKLTTKADVEAAALYSYELAYSAHETLNAIVQRTTAAFAERVAADGASIVVANPSAIPRTELLELRRGDGGGESNVEFIAQHVAPFSIARLKCVAGPLMTPDAFEAGERTIRGNGFLVEFGAHGVSDWRQNTGPESTMERWLTRSGAELPGRLSLRLPFPADDEYRWYERPVSLAGGGSVKTSPSTATYAIDRRNDVLRHTETRVTTIDDRIEWTGTVNLGASALDDEAPDPLRFLLPIVDLAPESLGAEPLVKRVSWTSAAGVIGDDDFLPGVRSLTTCTTGAIRIEFAAPAETPRFTHELCVFTREAFAFQRGAPGWMGEPRPAPGDPLWLHLLDRPVVGETKDAGKVRFERLEPTLGDERTFHLAFSARRVAPAIDATAIARRDAALVKEALRFRCPLVAIEYRPWFPSTVTEVGAGPLVSISCGNESESDCDATSHVLVLSCRPARGGLDEILVDLQEIGGIAADGVEVRLALPGFIAAQHCNLAPHGITTIRFTRE